MNRILGGLEILALSVVGILFFQGKGSHSVFIAITLAVPIVRSLLQKSYRLNWFKRYSDFREKCDQYRTLEKYSAIPTKGILFFIVGPALFFSLINGNNISSMDNYPTSAVAASIILDGDVEISESYPTHFFKGETVPRDTARKACSGELPQSVYWIRCSHSKAYSAYPPGMVFFALPVNLLGYILGGKIGNSHHQWRLAKWTASLIHASSLSFFFLISLLFVPFPAAYLMTLILASSSTILMVVGQALWTQGGVMWGVLLLLLTQLLSHNKPNFKIAVLQGLIGALTIACRIPAVILIGPIFLWILLHSRLQFIITFIVFLFGISLLGFYQWNIYHSVLGPQVTMASGFELGRDIPSTFYGHLFSPGCGLFIYNPWIWIALLLLIPGIRKSVSFYWKRSGSKTLWPLLILASTLHMLIVSSWPGWWGAAWGPRYLVEIIPFIALSLLGVLHLLLQTARGRQCMGFLIFLSFIIQVPGLFLFAGNWFYDFDRAIYPTMKSEEARIFDWNNPPFLYPFRK